MPNLKQSELLPMQLGKYAEYYSKMEFTSCGYDVNTSEIDGHGVDFVAKNPKTGIFQEVQVKVMMKGNYVYIRKDKIIIDETYIVCLLRFEDVEMPKLYIFDSNFALK